MKPTATNTTLAYSYVRFSTPDQAKGDSLRRQTQAAADWCNRNGATLDTSTTLHDLGRSAFLGEHRKNPDRCALAAFLKLVEDGKVPRGSTLIVESLDRLSREHIRPALTLLLQLIEAGVRVVQLIPVEALYDDKVEPMQLMMAIMELSRGHSESAVKSERIGAAWAEKKARAREGHIITKRLPGWVRLRGGKLELIPAAGDAVRRVFELARSGYGCQAIAKKLNEDKVPPINRNGVWMRSYVGGILGDRRAVGELQPRKRDGSPDGAPIPNYYPQVVTDEEWHAARAAAATRRRPGAGSDAPPPSGSLHNLFAGLITDARNGGSYYAVQRADGRNKPANGEWPRVLINTKSVEGEVPCVSFPLLAFERGILSALREIDPSSLFAGTAAVSNAATLAADLAREEQEIARLEEELENAGDTIPAVVRVLGRKEARRKALAAQLAEARAREATPVTAAWGECQSLVDMLDTAVDRDDLRHRLRGAIRRIVSAVTLLAVGRGRTRLAAVRLDFIGTEAHRDYFLVSRPAINNGRKAQPPVNVVGDHKFEGAAGERDLRTPEGAKAVEQFLTAVDVEKLIAVIGVKNEAK